MHSVPNTPVFCAPLARAAAAAQPSPPHKAALGSGAEKKLSQLLSCSFFLQVPVLVRSALLLRCSPVLVGAVIQHPPDCTPLKIFHLR